MTTEVNDKVIYFDTPDIGLAGFLHANGVKFKDAQKVPIKERGGKKVGERFAFVFNNNDGECQKLEIDYGNEGLVKARDYDNSIKFLKMIVKSKRYNPTPTEKHILKIDKEKNDNR